MLLSPVANRVWDTEGTWGLGWWVPPLIITPQGAYHYPQYTWASLLAQSVKSLPAVRETGFDPWVGKIPWRRAWHPTPVFLPGESPWTEEPGGLQSMGSQTQTRLSDQAHTHISELSEAQINFLTQTVFRTSKQTKRFEWQGQFSALNAKPLHLTALKTQLQSSGDDPQDLVYMQCSNSPVFLSEV